MESKEEMLKKLGLKTMFNISDEEMPELVEEYDILWIMYQCWKNWYNRGWTISIPLWNWNKLLREDNPVDVISLEDVLANAKSVQENQIKVPKVVG